MRIDELLANQRPVFSVEFFPPKTEEGVEPLFETVAALKPLEPDLRLGHLRRRRRDPRRHDRDRRADQREYGVEAMAHLSCVGETREGLAEILDRFAGVGIDNVLALRGDPPRGEAEFSRPDDGLSSAAELTGFIAERYGFAIGGACFPEVHPEAAEPRGRPRLPEDQGRRRRDAS